MLVDRKAGYLVRVDLKSEHQIVASQGVACVHEGVDVLFGSRRHQKLIFSLSLVRPLVHQPVEDTSHANVLAYLHPPTPVLVDRSPEIEFAEHVTVGRFLQLVRAEPARIDRLGRNIDQGLPVRQPEELVEGESVHRILDESVEVV